MTSQPWLDLLTVAILVMPVIDWLAVVLLWRSYRRAQVVLGYPPTTLKERGQAATVIAIATTFTAFLAVNRMLHGPLPVELTVLILVFVVLLPSLANLLWLVRALRGDFDRSEGDGDDA